MAAAMTAVLVRTFLMVENILLAGDE